MNQWEELQSAAINGRVSRREFMRRATALGVATSLASGVLAKAGYAQTPVKGGTLRVGIAGGSTTDNLDITTYTDTTMINVSTSVFDGLVEVDDKNQIQPELLESLEPSDDATEWVCNVRKGITFSNGKTLDADDIVYSINLHRGEGSKSGAAGPMKPIKDVVKMSDSQVKIVLEAPDADLPYVLSDYHVTYVNAAGRTVVDSTPATLHEGWNVVTRRISGQTRSFLIFGDTSPPEIVVQPATPTSIPQAALSAGFALYYNVVDNGYYYVDSFFRRFTGAELMARPIELRADGSRFITLEFPVEDQAGNRTLGRFELTLT